MAKVTNPLFGDFIEAVSNIFVIQNNGSGTPIARRKVRHATNPRSAHFPGRAANWARAVTEHQKAEAPNADLTNFISRYALSPDRPFNLRTESLITDPGPPESQIAVVAWDEPTLKYNGWPLDNLAGYFVETTVDFVSWQRHNTAPITAAQLEINIPAGDVYFIVFAVDYVGNVSAPSEAVLIEYVPGGYHYNENRYNMGTYCENGSPVPDVEPPNAPTGLIRLNLYTCQQHANCWQYDLQWTPPTHRTDGTPLDGLAGYYAEISYNWWQWDRYNEELFAEAQAQIHAQNMNHQTRIVAVDLYDNISAPSNAVWVWSFRPPPIAP